MASLREGVNSCLALARDGVIAPVLRIGGGMETDAGMRADITTA